MIFLTFFLGLIANFTGYIPPGNINLTLVRITINRGMNEAVKFVVAFSVVEFFFTFFIMHAAKWLSAQVNLDVVIDWVMFALFLVLGIITWLARNHPPKTNYSEHASIKYGLLLGIINPMQVPFWMICGTYLITHQWIAIGTPALIVFSIGSAAGSFLCLFLYARFARYIQNKFALSNRVINTAIAILFFSLAGYHLVKRVYLAVKPKEESAQVFSSISDKQIVVKLKLIHCRWL
jgi:threonine/homoserine/homoserine lactone efflux protein